MDLQEYLARMNSGEPVQGGGDMHRFMREINEVTMRLTCELNNKYHTGEEVREIFSKIIGKPVDKSFRLFPPFYTNCGKNTTVGKGVFINPGCHFQDQGGITLGDGTVCLPAGLDLISEREALVTLREGKYHQVKRMLASRGKPVVYLKRLGMGKLKLDPALPAGAWRPLTPEELADLGR